MSMYGQTKVAGAQKKDIALEGQKYEEERTKQAGFQGENAGTVADTLKTYSPDANAARMADATTRRQDLYTAPISAKNFVADTPADFDPNNVIAARNRDTGMTQKLKSLSMAGTKGKLDAYGDANTVGNILAANNANKIGMVGRIADMSARAQAGQQAVLPAKLEADKGAGATYAQIGDGLKMAAMLSSGSGYFGTSEAGVEGSGASWLTAHGAPSWLTGYNAPSFAGPSAPGYSGIPRYG